MFSHRELSSPRFEACRVAPGAYLPSSLKGNTSQGGTFSFADSSVLPASSVLTPTLLFNLPVPMGTFAEIPTNIVSQHWLFWRLWFF